MCKKKSTIFLAKQIVHTNLLLNYPKNFFLSISLFLYFLHESLFQVDGPKMCFRSTGASCHGDSGGGMFIKERGR